VPRQFSRQSFVVKRDGDAVPYEPPSPVPASAAAPAPLPASSFRSPHEGFFARARAADTAARASNGHHMFQNLSSSGSAFTPSSFDAAAPPASTPAWSVTAIREHVAAASVAVLVEVRAGDEVRQHWGGSPVGPAGVGPALAEAQRDGVERALGLFRPESGIPSPTPARLGWNGDGTVDTSPARVAPPPTSPTATPAAPSEASAASLSARFDAQLSTSDDDRNAMATAAAAAAVNSIENGSYPESSALASTSPSAFASASPACDSVLIVDDDKVNVKVLHRAFSNCAFGTVTTGEDGQDAVQLLINQDAKFDVVLIDENMRHMNGTVAIERVRAREARQGCPGRQLVVVTSGNSSHSDMIKYQKAGMNAMLVKPMNLKGVVRWVRDYHAFFMHTRAVGGWKAGQPLPDWCPKPEFRPDSTFEDGYFFGDVEVFGTIPRR
jgi:CheY-like chemotaxis protein